MKNNLFVQKKQSYTLEQYLSTVIKKYILDKSTDLVFNVFYESKMKSNVLTITNPDIRFGDVFEFCIRIEDYITEDMCINLANIKDLLADLIYENICETSIKDSDVRTYIRENLIVSKKTITKLEEFQKFIRTRDTLKLKGSAKYKNVMIIVNHHIKDKIYDIMIINKDHGYTEKYYRLTDDEIDGNDFKFICNFVAMNFFNCKKQELDKALSYIYSATHLNNIE